MYRRTVCFSLKNNRVLIRALFLLYTSVLRDTRQNRLRQETESEWNAVRESFRRACRAHRQGLEHLACSIVDQEMAERIELWSALSMLSPDAKKQALLSMFVSEGRSMGYEDLFKEMISGELDARHKLSAHSFVAGAPGSSDRLTGVITVKADVAHGGPDLVRKPGIHQPVAK